MLRLILAWLSPSRFQFAPEELKMILRYDTRRHRAVPLDVESEASSARSMMLHQTEPGRYIGLGNTVIKERRKTFRGK